MTGSASLSHNNTGNLVVRNTGNNGWLHLIAAEHNHILSNLWLLDTKDKAGNTLAYIQNIGCALTEILIIHGLEDLGRLIGRCQYSCWCVTHLLNFVCHTIGEHRILCQEHMSLHDIGLLIMTCSTHLLNALFQTISYLGNCLAELFLLLLDSTRLICSQITIQCLASLQNTANGIALDSSHSLQFLWHN